MTVKEVAKGIDVEEFMKQKEWLAGIISKLKNNENQYPEGILHLLDELQDAMEEEYGTFFVQLSETEEVTEYCSECGREVTMNWNVKEDGLKAFCPHCGVHLMLCSYCPATNPDSNYSCTFNNSTCDFYK